QEIRTARFLGNRWLSFVPRVWRLQFWFGLLYGFFSNFGRSLLRPPIVWAGLFLLSAGFYLGESERILLEKERTAQQRLETIHYEGLWPGGTAYYSVARGAWAKPACIANDMQEFATTDRVHEALYLSLRNGLVGFDAARGEATRRIHGCLYGMSRGGE